MTNGLMELPVKKFHLFIMNISAGEAGLLSTLRINVGEEIISAL